jgi:hypothetical protein
MGEVERVFLLACEMLQALAGSMGTILIIALTFGLLCAAAGLTVLVLWKSFSFSFRFAALKAWVKARDYLTRYFNRLRQYGLTRVASRIAVLCGLVVWMGIVLGFAFSERLLDALVASLVVLLASFAWGWRQRGPRATFFRFTRGFVEPTMALAVPTFVAKSGDFLFKFVVSSVRTLL